MSYYKTCDSRSICGSVSLVSVNRWKVDIPWCTDSSEPKVYGLSCLCRLTHKSYRLPNTHTPEKCDPKKTKLTKKPKKKTTQKKRNLQEANLKRIGEKNWSWNYMKWHWQYNLAGRSGSSNITVYESQWWM